MRSALLLLAALLAGCAAPAEGPMPTSVVHGHVEVLTACYDYFAVFPGDAPEALPEGFSSVPHGIPGRASVATMAWTCDVEGNGSTSSRAEHAEGFLVTPPEELALDGARHVALRTLVSGDENQTALLVARGFALAKAGTVALGYNSRTPEEHLGGFSADAEGVARGLYMAGRSATIVERAPIRLLAIVDAQVIAIMDIVPTVACEWAGAGEAHDGAHAYAVLAPTSATPADATHGEGAATARAVRMWLANETAPALPILEGLDPGADPATACATQAL